VTRIGTKTARVGCLGLFWLLVFLFALSAVFIWPSYLDQHGTVAAGVISEKRETIRVHYGEWYRRFEILADYTIPHQPVPHRTICDVDEKTYDSIHMGNGIAVHYMASLPIQPFLPTAHLAPCTTATSLGLNSAVLWRVGIAFTPLLAILLFWRLLRVKFFAWLLLPWMAFALVYLGIPRVEPEPQHPVSTTATVERVALITTLGDTSGRRSISLKHPYQIVVLKFVPPGMDTPVAAVDKVDSGSVPNLRPGEKLNISYDASNPRLVKLQQGTRLFPAEALSTAILFVAILLGLVLAGAGIGRLFRAAGKKASQTATRNLSFDAVAAAELLAQQRTGARAEISSHNESNPVDPDAAEVSNKKGT
jgi:hypothetical protein